MHVALVLGNNLLIPLNPIFPDYMHKLSWECPTIISRTFPRNSGYLVFSFSFCDLIGQLPLYLHDNSESEKRDHNHLDYLIQGHISLQTAGLLLSTLEIKVQFITRTNYVPFTYAHTGI